ncbi:MAG TPA: 23S rRNA (guanosine(2251)-2'-O)-methyltransferase RlmB [Chloroflexota bacterium]|nr:23S rRNA (guanosine(2251)-2'-O)-methyltransferase RlmB [Chloroflexota bacterium]
MECIWGRHPVVEALRAGRAVEVVYLSRGIHRTGIIDEILRLATERGIRVQWVDRRFLDRLSGQANHQGVAAEVAEYRYQTLDGLIAAGRQAPGLPLILALDALEDPQNFGTLLRTADAVGITGVIIPLHRAVGVTPAVEKASAGAVEFLRIARVTNLARALEELKGEGYWIVGLDAAAPLRYDQFAVDVPLVLVVGAEGRGLGRLVRAACDLLVSLPMRGHVAALNAAVAGSIVLYEVLRRRGGA